MKIVVYLTFLVALPAWALIPVEGILLGEANLEFQTDPLLYVFQDPNNYSNEAENLKYRAYSKLYASGIALEESCNLYKKPTYTQSLDEEKAQRIVVANLQYLGMDLTIKSIGALARKLNIDEEKYQTLTKNIVNNYCSKNITVISLKSISKLLNYYYKNPDQGRLTTIAQSSFSSEIFKKKSEEQDSRSREFEFALKSFRSFCSWGGDPLDLRMLVPYVKNPFIMAVAFRNMLKSDDDSKRISCREHICHDADKLSFERQFPRSLGSTGLNTDLKKLYCHQFKQVEYTSKSPVPQVKEWIKEMEIETPILETNFFISAYTGVPDVGFSAKSYQDIPLLLKSSLDERWTNWSKKVINTFSHELLYEESLKVKVSQSRVDLENPFRLNFLVTLGELDRLMDENDKLKVTFDLKISKNYFRTIKNQWLAYGAKVDLEGQENLKKEIASYLEKLLRGKEKYFQQRMWNKDFPRIMADELLKQALAYKGSLYRTYEEKMLNVPIQFSYGVFALSYLRYRADVDAGRLKLNL